MAVMAGGMGYRSTTTGMAKGMDTTTSTSGLEVTTDLMTDGVGMPTLNMRNIN